MKGSGIGSHLRRGLDRDDQRHRRETVRRRAGIVDGVRFRIDRTVQPVAVIVHAGRPPIHRKLVHSHCRQRL